MANYHSRDLRKGRHSEAGRAYLVTVNTLERRRIFDSLPRARVVVNAMRHLHEMQRVESLCFVVMPDHLHWLFLLNRPASLSSVANALKSIVSRRLRRTLQWEGEVWQRGFHDRALRRDEDLMKIARYIVANPLRAGLVGEIGLYAHWDAKWL